MPKLKFKRTPEEEAEHQARKARRKEKKRKRTASDPRSHGTSSKRAHGDHRDGPARKWDSGEEDDIPEMTSRADKAENPHMRPRRFSERMDDDAVRAQVEEEMFREKLFGAMGEDERLDGLESHLNDFVHVPDRWKQAATGEPDKVLYEEDDFLRLDPSTLDDDEYAEWVRLGMYRYAAHSFWISW